MLNIFSSRRYLQLTSSSSVSCCNSYYYAAVSCNNFCCTSMSVVTDNCIDFPAILAFQTFFFWLKTKNPLNKQITLPKTFPYLLIFPSANLNLVTYLALYKKDQATTLPRQHNRPITHYILTLSLSYLETSSFCYS